MADVVIAEDFTGHTRGQNWKIFSYFAPLTLLVALIGPAGTLADIAVSFMLKDKLHASATEVSVFRLIVTLPLLASAAFGLARDHWNPFGRRDRGLILIFATLAVATYGIMSVVKLSYTGLVAGMLTATIFTLFLSASHQGLLALIGQESRMSGRLAALWNLVSYIPVVGGSFLGGLFAEKVSPAGTFMILAGGSVCLAVFALWKPATVYDQAYDREEAKGGRLLEDVRRLLRSPAIYAPILLPFLFNFCPGFGTPFQYYMTNDLQASPSAYANFWALYYVGFTPFFLLYGWFISRVNFRILLWVGLILAGPNVAILLILHSASEILAIAPLMGAMAAIGWCALGDLAIRSCPRGLHGTLMLLTSAAGTLGYRFSDVVGARLYDVLHAEGFAIGIVISVLVSFLCLPVILLVPREIMQIREGILPDARHSAELSS